MAYNQLGGYNNVGGGLQPPQGVTTVTNVSTGVTSASVNYSYSLSDEDGFNYRIDGGPFVDIGVINPFLISGLAADTQYSVEVVAYNAQGNGTISSPFIFTTNSIPVQQECYIGVVGVITEPEQELVNGFNGTITDINGLSGSLCNDVCCS